MKIALDNPAGVAAPVGPYSHVARIDLAGGTLLILSGQVALDDAGQLVGADDMTAQAERIFEVIAGLLEAHGASYADVVHIRTFLVDMDRRREYGAVRARSSPTRRRRAPPWRFRACSSPERCWRSRSPPPCPPTRRRHRRSDRSCRFRYARTGQVSVPACQAVWMALS